MAGVAEAAIAALAKELVPLLETEKSISDDRHRQAELAAFAQLLRPLIVGPKLRQASDPPTRLPVCSHFAASLNGAASAASGLVASLETLERFFIWTQNPNYRRSPPSPGFLDRYGYAVIAGPVDGAPALARHPDLALGLLLLAPETTYPAHRHPASEIYVPLGPAEWMRGDAPFAERAAGSVIHHPPNLVHATRTGALPLAALYLWAGDLATHARLSH